MARVALFALKRSKSANDATRHFQPGHFLFGPQKGTFYRGQFVIWPCILIVILVQWKPVKPHSIKYLEELFNWNLEKKKTPVFSLFNLPGMSTAKRVIMWYSFPAFLNQQTPFCWIMEEDRSKRWKIPRIHISFREQHPRQIPKCNKAQFPTLKPQVQVSVIDNSYGQALFKRDVDNLHVSNWN